MTTPILNLQEVQSGQVNQYLVYNEALRFLESSINAVLMVDLSAGNAVVTNTDSDNYAMLRSGVFVMSGNAVAGRKITFSANARQFTVHNQGSAAGDVVIGTTAVSVPAGGAYRFYADGTANGLCRVE